MTGPETHHDLPDTPLELVKLIDAAAAKLAATSLVAMPDDEVLPTVEIFERAHRRTDGVDAALFTELSDRMSYRKAGYLSPTTYLESGLRLGSSEAKRRRTVAAAIAHMTSFQGETLDPALPATADAVSDGAIGTDHVLQIEKTMDRIPHRVADDVRADAEAQLAEAARALSPAGLATVGNRLLAHLDPDGDLTDDRDRKRTRGFTVQPQDRQLMSKVRAMLKPELRAKLEALLLQWAAPGINNPDDDQSPYGAANDPEIDTAALTAAAERDDRTQTQRNHDALEAMLDYLIGHGALGRPTGLPAHLVVTASLTDIEQRTGVAHTATGTRLPVKDLVDLAAHATPWLEVFADHSSSILYLGRGRRLASLAQRIAIFGRDRGCTAPGCTAPFSRTQAHHMPDWQHGGPTDIDHLGAACGGDNRKVSTDPGGWETTIIAHGPHQGRVGWRPTGSSEPWQVNHTHLPEKLLRENPDVTPSQPDPADESRQRRRRSRIERWLECRIPSAPQPVPPDEVTIEFID
ncbi:HNH endonuclease signature motif containing protein [Gordonia zhaorongruii]|uniref:HNH endonuclease signature motif containing protein n=1 Tax=Gordonia zhaorongruii TaxID=2597659 RepID=UPI001F3DE276|nr:HNH endonuclease signature motif containing protein [Gordonia zhaorongruii]